MGEEVGIGARERYDCSVVAKKPADRLIVIRKRVSKVPTDPGVYRWFGAGGELLYVGKAKNLRARMKSYVVAGAKHSPWTEIMVRRIEDFEVTVVRSELEALILESNLIKELKPKYNIMLKDDKGYVYVRISVQEKYPCIDVVRRIEEDGAKYFGPFLGARYTEQSLEMLDDLLHFRACRKSLDHLNKADDNAPLTGGTPCIDHQIGRCSGLCIGAVSEAEHRARIDEVISFFRGNFASVKKRTEEQMRAAAAEKKFERAGRLRDALKFIEELEQKQAVSDTTGEDIDVFGVALQHGKIQVILLRQRGGKLIGQVAFALKGEADNATDIVAQFLPQYYGETQDIPDIIILGEELPEKNVLETWLRERKGKIVRILIPERGKKSRLLEMAERNAQEKVEQQFAAWEAEGKKAEDAMAELAALIGLTGSPKRIEGYDISHLGGNATVGSMVVFVNGKPKREHYRSFNMKTVAGGDIDDYKSLGETLRRRLRYLTLDLKTEEKSWKEKGITFGKVKKAERENVLVHLRKETHFDINVDFTQCVVARKEEKIIACGCLHLHPSGRTELCSVWVDDAMRGAKLGHVVSRMLLKHVKKTKVYLGAKPSLEDYYADIGFRHVIDPSAELIADINRGVEEFKDDIVMMYDGKQQKTDESFSSRPDLLLIDGGKGQLTAVVEVLKESGLDIPVASLAKREEEIFIPGNSQPLIVKAESQARFLLQRIRDESHRFANDRRKRRLDTALFHSKLDEVPGIGDETKMALLRKFGSADAAIAAGDEELKEVLNERQLRHLREKFGGM